MLAVDGLAEVEEPRALGETNAGQASLRGTFAWRPDESHTTCKFYLQNVYRFFFAMLRINFEEKNPPALSTLFGNDRLDHRAADCPQWTPKAPSAQYFSHKRTLCP